MGKFKRFLNFLFRMIVACVYLILAIHFGNLKTLYVIFFCIGVFLCGVVSDFLCGHNGKLRVALFLLGSATLIIPSFILNIVMFKQSGSLYEQIHFLVSATLIFMIWLGCADQFDSSLVILELQMLGGEVISILMVRWIVKTIFMLDFNLSIVYFIGGVVILLVFIIKRLKGGSAFAVN